MYMALWSSLIRICFQVHIFITFCARYLFLEAGIDEKTPPVRALLLNMPSRVVITYLKKKKTQILEIFFPAKKQFFKIRNSLVAERCISGVNYFVHPVLVIFCGGGVTSLTPSQMQIQRKQNIFYAKFLWKPYCIGLIYQAETNFNIYM